MEITKILKSNNYTAIKSLFSFDTETNELILEKFNLWARYFFPNYFTSQDAPFHRMMDNYNLECYLGTLTSFVNIQFRGSGKTSRTKLFLAFCIANDLLHRKKYIKILSADIQNAKQLSTDIYNMLVDISWMYPEIFQKNDKKREETMESFTTSTGVKLSADSVGTNQRGRLQEYSRPDLLWFEDIENRETLRSAVKTKSIWDNMEEARTGLAKRGSSIYCCNYISERGNVHTLVTKEGFNKKVMIVPILDGDTPTWDRYNLDEINQMKQDDDDFEGERMCKPSASKDVMFDRETLEKMEKRQPIRSVAGFKMFRQYNPSHRYALGADVAGGVGFDSSASVIIDFDTMPAQVVATFADNSIKPDVFGDELKRHGEYYGECYIAPEKNNHGHATIGRLKQIYPIRKIHVTQRKETRIDEEDNPTEYGWHTNGAPLDVNTKVLTPNGWTIMGSLKVGDYVMSHDGEPTKVTGVYPQGYLNAIALKTSDGTEIICDATHLWAVQSKYEKNGFQEKPIQTKDIKTNFHYIPLIKPVEFTTKEFPIDPYFLGLLLGDGGLSRETITFTTVDKELIDFIKTQLPMGASVKKNQGDSCSYRITSERDGHKYGTSNFLNGHIKNLGLYGLRSWEKHIPEQYMLGDEQQRLSLLQGLMDTDGCATKNHASYSSTSKKLAEQVRDLVLSLGGWAKIKFNKNNHRGYYLVTVCTWQNPFRLKRKSNKDGIRRIMKRRNVTEIKPMNEKREMVCISIKNSRGLFIIENYLITHNTKPKMLFDLVKAVNDGLLVLNDENLIAEAKSYTRNDLMDKEIDPRLTTRHFDILTATAICWQMKDYVGISDAEKKRNALIQEVLNNQGFDPYAVV